MRGLWRLAWLETKIFVREPLGLFGTLAVPVLTFVGFARFLGPRRLVSPAADMPRFVTVDLPVFTALLIASSAVLSLVTIVAIYREGGILKRLRATPLRPYTILTAHVLVKLLFTVVSLVLMMAAGRRFFPVGATASPFSFGLAVLFTTLSFLSIGFVVGSLV